MRASRPMGVGLSIRDASRGQASGFNRFRGPACRSRSPAPAKSAVWRKEGQEILYLDQDRIWSVRVDTSGNEFRASAPELLFAVRSLEGGRRVNGISQIAVSRDGSHIYYQQPSRATGLRCHPRKNGLGRRPEAVEALILCASVPQCVVIGGRWLVIVVLDLTMPVLRAASSLLRVASVLLLVAQAASAEVVRIDVRSATTSGRTNA